MKHCKLAIAASQVPTVSVLNLATVPLGYDFGRMVTALQNYISNYFAPVWGTTCAFKVAKKFIPKGTWGLILADDADQVGALGYHWLTDDNLPTGYVFVKDTLRAREQVPVTLSHEATEMLQDPYCNVWALNEENGDFWAWEVADAVEETNFAVNSMPMSNFVFPAAYQSRRKPKSTKFDYLGLTSKPFQLLKGGYSLVSQSGQVTQIFGSVGKGKRFAKEDRRLHRSEWR